MLGLYSLGGIRDITALAIIGGSAMLPAMLMGGSSFTNELAVDAMIIAGPALSMWYYDVLNLDNAFYFTLGALLLQAMATTVNNKRK